MNERDGSANLRRRVLGGFVRLLVVVILAATVGALLTRVAVHSEDRPEPAGFGRGMLQGALMPMAMPNLLVGRDVPIYAERNTGRLYKLGYTVGVNVCGAVFFGYVFWRLLRLRKLAERIQNR